MPHPRSTTAGVLVALLCAVALGGPAQADPVLAPPTVVAGPSSAITSLGGLSIARDGTGGLVFTEAVGGADHVFVSRVAGGSFAAPVQVDPGLAGASTQPVIAAGNGGLLLVAFVNGGALYTATAPTGAAPVGAPAPLLTGASDPAISISNFSKAYIAFTASGAGGHDVRAALYNAGRWALVPAALDAAAGDDAGTAGGRPAVVTAGDGVAIVAWGENGHIYSRRVWGTAASSVYQQADPPAVAGQPEVSADEPTVASGADSSYAAVGFRETVATGAGSQTRVLVNRLVAGSYQGPAAADGSPAGENADAPLAASSEYGRGFLLSTRTTSHALYAQNLLANEGVGGAQRVDSQANLADPFATIGLAGLFSSVIAWQQTPAQGPAEIHLRFGADGGSLAPEQVASDPSLGPTDAARGLSAGGDVAGDAAAAWVQGTGADTRIVVAQMYQPPGSFALAGRGAYLNVSQPVLSWSAARESWGALVYHVLVDGVLVGQTTATLLKPPAPLAEGPHTLQVTAVNPAGSTSSAGPVTIHVDTLAPLVVVTLTGRRVVGAKLRLRLDASDLRPGEPAAGSSGIVSRNVRWGDGSSATPGSFATHVYRRPGLYRVLLSVADRSGNVTRVARFLRIRSAPARRRSARPGRHR